MVSKRFLLGMLVIGLIFNMILNSCASIQPMSEEAKKKYALASNPSNFKNFQYYVSRDITLTYIMSAVHATGVGQINVNRDIIQILSSTPGVILEVEYNANGETLLGVAFEPDNDNLLWFLEVPSSTGGFFYLAYDNVARREISYGNNMYTVSLTQATGLGASIKRLNPFSKFRKVKKMGFENMEPILLYEEIVKESEQRRNVQGRKLQ